MTQATPPLPPAPTKHGRGPGRGRLTAAAVLALGSLSASLAVADAAPTVAEPRQRQVALSTRSAPLITMDELRFRDLDRDGRLTPYEDWRLTPKKRAADLLGRMTIAEKAGLLVHGTLPVSGTSYRETLAGNLGDLIGIRKMTSFVTRLSSFSTFPCAAVACFATCMCQLNSGNTALQLNKSCNAF